MKVCDSWLREWVNPDKTVNQVAEQLTMAGLEVDSISPVAGDFQNVVVACVIETEAHPKADRLTICQVDFGEETPATVVCGAANVRKGLKVALAKLGATLPGGFKIKEVKLRGQLSQGMLCSTEELGIEDSAEGIMELASDAPVGQDLREYMDLEDTIFDVDLTPNRADCFSILGVARELSAINQKPLAPLPSASVAVDLSDTLSIEVKESNACPRYTGRIIRGINPHVITPLWMQERLRRAGVRTVHPVVDVTNYVMLELGQPMHAFDLNQLNGSIVIRRAKNEEPLTLLDNQEVVLSESVLVIADESQPLAIAGVMGGAASAVTEETTDIFLESAFFNPIDIAGVARKYKLCTDSSQRFERGVDPKMQKIALERATELLVAIVGGQVGPISKYSELSDKPPVTVLFDPRRVKQLTGVDVDFEYMKVILEHLGMQLDCNSEVWKVIVPSHRFDIALDVDLVEEVIRLYGYNNIQSEKMTAATCSGQINSLELTQAKVSDILRYRGYHETISYSFVDPELQKVIYPDDAGLSLLNPISKELSDMRMGLWPGLLASMIYNAHRQQTAIKLFECGVIFNTKGEALSEKPCVAGLLTGEQGQLNWAESDRPFDFFDMKGDLQGMFTALGHQQFSFISAQHPALHPGKTARIVADDKAIGWMGVLHPQIADEMDVTHDVMLFELSMDALKAEDKAQYQRISKYPQIRRDLSLLVDEEITAAEIETIVRSAVQQRWLKSFDVFDVYIGDGIPKGKKSIAVAITLQDNERTLVDDEINSVIDAILNSLESKFAITLRD